MTLLVTPKQAQAVQLAAQGNRPWLVLRSLKDGDEVKTDGTSMAELTGRDDGAEGPATPGATPALPVSDTSPRPAALAPSTQPATPKARPMRVVQVINGGVLTEVQVPVAPDAPHESPVAPAAPATPPRPSMPARAGRAGVGGGRDTRGRAGSRPGPHARADHRARIRDRRAGPRAAPAVATAPPEVARNAEPDVTPEVAPELEPEVIPEGPARTTEAEGPTTTPPATPGDESREEPKAITGVEQELRAEK